MILIAHGYTKYKTTLSKYLDLPLSNLWTYAQVLKLLQVQPWSFIRKMRYDARMCLYDVTKLTPVKKGRQGKGKVWKEGMRERDGEGRLGEERKGWRTKRRRWERRNARGTERCFRISLCEFLETPLYLTFSTLSFSDTELQHRVLYTAVCWFIHADAPTLMQRCF